jgi:hypothetical protein
VFSGEDIFFSSPLSLDSSLSHSHDEKTTDDLKTTLKAEVRSAESQRSTAEAVIVESGAKSAWRHDFEK